MLLRCPLKARGHPSSAVFPASSSYHSASGAAADACLYACSFTGGLLKTEDFLALLSSLHHLGLL
jgi:hypothetical protein